MEKRRGIMLSNYDITVNDFEIIINNVLTSLKNDKVIIANSKDELLIGDMQIVDNDGTYTVIDTKRRITLIDSLTLIESALTYALSNDKSIKRKIILCDAQYSKHIMDAVFHRNALLTAKNVGDVDRLEVSEILLTSALSEATYYRNEILSLYKRISQKDKYHKH